MKNSGTGSATSSNANAPRTGSAHIEDDYYVLYRQAARRAVADIDPSHSRDRDRYRILQEIYDAVEEIYDIRSAKLRMAVQDRVVFRRDVDRPENLTAEEQERYDMAISLGGTMLNDVLQTIGLLGGIAGAVLVAGPTPGAGRRVRYLDRRKRCLGCVRKR